MLIKIYIIGFIFTAIWCGIAQLYCYGRDIPKFWKILFIVTFGNGLIFPLTWIVIMFRFFQTKENFNKNKFRIFIEYIGSKLI